MSTAAFEAPAIGRAEQFSTRVAFFIAGFGGAVWAGLVPFAKMRAGLAEGSLDEAAFAVWLRPRITIKPGGQVQEPRAPYKA